MPRDLVDRILSQPVFSDVAPGDFPSDLSLHDIIANDSRVLDLASGDIVFRQGTYGTSLFVVLEGDVCGLTTAAGEKAARRYERPNRKPSAFGWLRPQPAERSATGLRLKKPAKITSRFPTARHERNSIFGEVAALTRSPRSNTIFADCDGTQVLEIRWPGVRDLRHWSDAFRRRIDEAYRRDALDEALRQCALFDQVDPDVLKMIRSCAELTSYGSFGWTHGFQTAVSRQTDADGAIDREPAIVRQNDYLDDVLVIGAGFARLSEKLHAGDRTVGYLTPGDVYGLDCVAADASNTRRRSARHSLYGMGYVDVIRIPVAVVDAHLLPAIDDVGQISSLTPSVADLPSRMLDFMVDSRLVNGTRAMAINMDRCVNCDDCVRACAATHDEIPRFKRHGPVHNRLMIAHACMHCIDPVCLIDCPTEAIHRDPVSGTVVIQDASCIGCGTCAAACPYDNIQMEAVRNSEGAFLIDEDGAHIQRATKCDFCAGRSGGPACQRACPHDALIRVDIKSAENLSDWLKHTH